LRNKTITVIFGDENEVALIVVESDVVDNDLFTKYDEEDNEITVGGEKYELADLEDLTVIVNDVPVTATDDEENALKIALETILGAELTTKTFKKNIEAELTLDEDEDVKKIVMFVSGNYDDFNTTETVVTKVRAEKITTTKGNITWEADKYEDDEYPRVYIDNVKAEITDIEAGDVLTVFDFSNEASEISVIYAARNTVEGEVSKVKNGFEIYVDGDAYLPSEIIKALTLKGDLDTENITTEDKDFNSVHGETAVLYMNVLGEYVMVDADTVDSDWQFAIVDKIYDVEEDDEDEDIFTQQLRLVMMDGSKVRTFKLVYDDEEKTDYKADYTHPDLVKEGFAIVNAVEKEEIIAFKANADHEIDLDDIVVVNTEDVSKNTAIEDYNFILVPTELKEGDSIDFDAKRFEIDETRYKVTSNTTLLNKAEAETLKWKELVHEEKKVVGAPTLLIVEEDETEIAHVIALADPDGVESDVEFALVLDATYTTTKTKTEAKLLGVDGKEYVYEYDANTNLVEGTLISYKVSGDKLKVEAVNVDLVAATEADDEKIIIGENAKGAYLVESVDSDYFTYTDAEDADYDKLDTRIIDVNLDDVIVVSYELDDEEIGTFVEADFDEETIKDAYVLSFNMDNEAKDVELLIIIK